MLNKLLFLLIFLSPVLSFSQIQISADSANKLVMNGGDCSDRTFTRIEKLPSLKIPQEAFEDSLALYLASKNLSYDNESVIFQFVVNCHGEIRNISKIYGSAPHEKDLIEAIQKYSNLWLPGRQNNYIESAYVKFYIEFKEGKLNIQIKQ